MSTRKRVVEDKQAETLLLAQLGARVLEILREPGAALEAAADAHGYHDENDPSCAVCLGPRHGDGVHRLVELAARSLDLLGEERPDPRNFDSTSPRSEKGGEA